MRKLLFTLLVIGLLLVPMTIAAAPLGPTKLAWPPVLMTIHNPDPGFLVTVWSIPSAKCTTFDVGVNTKDVGPAPYRLYGGNAHEYDLWVLDMEKNIVASSYWPGQPYTARQAGVALPGEYWVMRQIVPIPNSNVQISDSGAGKMTLGIPDPSKGVVVRAGVNYYTFYSRPAGVTEEVIPGPYIFNGSGGFNLLVIKDGKLVASSYWPGQPFTRGRATVGGNGGAYYVFEQHVPQNVPNQ